MPPERLTINIIRLTINIILAAGILFLICLCVWGYNRDERDERDREVLKSVKSAQSVNQIDEMLTGMKSWGLLHLGKQGSHPFERIVECDGGRVKINVKRYGIGFATVKYIQGSATYAPKDSHKAVEILRKMPRPLKISFYDNAGQKMIIRELSEETLGKFQNILEQEQLQASP